MAGLKDIQELAFVVVRCNLGVNLELVHIGFAKFIRFPKALFNILPGGNRCLILHMGKLAVEGTEEQHDGGQTLLAIDYFQLIAVIFEGDDRPEEILAVVIERSSALIRDSKRKNIIPQGTALVFPPCVGALIIRDQEIGLFILKQILDCFLIYIKL